jgi:glycosyltransferase involved in cell wall biosynthesis
MKILQIIYESFGSPFGFGGAGVRAYEIYKRLKERHDITLLCMKYPGAHDQDIDGLRHIFIGTESGNLTKSVFAFTMGTADFVRKNGKRFDVIVENFLPSTPFFAKILTNTPVILQIQGIMGEHSFKKFSFFYSAPMYIVERIYPKLYDRFIFVSDVTKKKVMSGVKRRVKLCSVIPNGIGSEMLKVEPEDGDYMLFFSRIDIYTKGIDLLLKAFESIAAEYPDLKLVLAGYEFNKVEKLVSGLPSVLKERIKYAGFVTGEDKIRLLSKAKIFILPSRHESSPISILEAAACGKPVIVSDIDELEFVEENGFGISFPSGSVRDLCAAMELLLKSDDMRHDLGMNGREYAKKYLWDNIAVEFENMLRVL